MTPPAPLPPPLAPLCSHLSSCPVRSGPAVKPFSMAGAAGVFQVTSFNQPPPLQWAHRSGFPSHSAADPQEALLTQGSGGESGHRPEHVWSLGGGEEGPRLTRPRSGLRHSCPCSSLARTDLVVPPNFKGLCSATLAVPGVGEGWTCWVAVMWQPRDSCHFYGFAHRCGLGTGTCSPCPNPVLSSRPVSRSGVPEAPYKCSPPPPHTASVLVTGHPIQVSHPEVSPSPVSSSHLLDFAR